MGGGIRMNAGGKFGDIGSIRAGTGAGHGRRGEYLYDRNKDDLVFDYRTTNISSAPSSWARRSPSTRTTSEPNPPPEGQGNLDVQTQHAAAQYEKRGVHLQESPRAECRRIDRPGGVEVVMRVGGAESAAPKHANFIIAYPGCTAEDVLSMWSS